MDINQKLLAAFQVEHVEHLEGIRTCLARWEQESGVPNVDEAFRRAHSLKGAARVTGFSPVEALAHHLENLFALLRAKTLPADREVLHVAHAALDAIEDSAACLLEGRPAPDASRALAELDGLVQSGSQATSSAPPPVATRNDPVAADFEEESTSQVVESIGEEPHTLPKAAPPKPVSHASASQRPAARGLAQANETVRLSTVNLDRLLQSTGELLTENLQQDSLTRELNGIHQQLAGVEQEWESLKRTAAGPLRRLGATPELAGLARYVDLVEHEFSALSRRVRAARLLQQRSSWSMRLLAEQLQEDVRRARMVPAESEFQGFRKMMRDLARDQGKEIEFRVNGFDVQADRMVLQALKDPLMHILRNAVTHGIELPTERRRRGKATAGQVVVDIKAIGNRLTIEVTDDGQGVDLAQVSEVAVQRGAVSESEAAALSPPELARLLFQPGFSTSRTVTELAGRGMGLSAVYEAVARLQGEVEFRPRAEAGTSILVVVPLSICTHRLLLVACRGQTIAIPFFGIEALHHVKPHDVESIEGVPMAELAGQLTPLASLAKILANSDADTNIRAETLSVVVLRSGPKRVALVVDAFVAERNSLIKDLGPPADALSAFMGGILLEDGSVSLVLNPSELVEQFKPSKKAAVFVPARPADETIRPTVLVVDDSFTTRTLETSILETNGYRVRVAVDGVEALEQLRSEKIDLVISDIQMPRLDGFGLLEEIKRDQRLARIPVIVVSSVDGTEDQERGLRLGADAYIVKRRFDHQELLKTVKQIL